MVLQAISFVPDTALAIHTMYAQASVYVWQASVRWFGEQVGGLNKYC